MLVQIRDRKALSSLSLGALRAYLGALGWKDEGPWGNRPGSIFTTDGEANLEILVPTRDTVADYAEALAEAVAVLAIHEDRSQIEVFYDLQGAKSDVVRLRSSNGLANERLSLSQSADLHSNAYKLLAASARAAERPQPAYRGRPSTKVEDFLNKVLPLPSQGGYDLTLHSPVAVDIGGQSDMGDEYHVPFSRQVTHKLAEALTYTVSAIEDALVKDTLDTFKTHVNRGVSANLCASVSELATKGQGVTIDLGWAAVRPSDRVDSHFPFTLDSAEVLLQASRSLSRNEPSMDEQIEAQIVQLAREPDEFDGRATLVSTWEGYSIRLSVKFEQHVYETVINAFRDQSYVSLLGDIYPTGRGYELRDPRNLLVVLEE